MPETAPTLTAGQAKALNRAAKLLREKRAAAQSGDGNTQKSGTAAGRAFGAQTVPAGAPSARKGENTMGSRGYSFANMMGLVAGTVEPEDCQLELDVSRRLKSAMKRCSGFNVSARSFVAPLCPEWLMAERDEDRIVDTQFGMELKSLLWEGQHKVDPEEVDYLTKKILGNAGLTYKTDAAPQSWLQQGLMGALVDFPTMGPLIPLLRNTNALLTAGAEVLPLGPTGRLAWPRETSAATYQWVGENTAGTETNVNTDQFLLSAKKLMALVRLPNELQRFAGPAAEQLARNNMTQSLSLGLDYTLLHSTGSANVPAGLIGYPGVNSFTPTTAATTNAGGKLAPTDPTKAVGVIEANNAGQIGGFGSWIMHPVLKQAFLTARAGVYDGAGVSQLGNFLFNVLRNFDPGTKREEIYLDGYRVVASSNVAPNRVQGTSTNNTAMFGGVWPDYKIGMYGAIEFVSTDQGLTLVKQDQTLVRAILSCDGGPFHPGVFGYFDPLQFSLSA